MKKDIKLHVRSRSTELAEDGQPAMHVRNKGMLEKLCTCFTERCDLTRKEAKYYVKFREEMVMLYNEQDPDHEGALKELYINVFPGSPVPDKIQTKEWQSIGFQS